MYVNITLNGIFYWILVFEETLRLFIQLKYQNMLKIAFKVIKICRIHRKQSILNFYTQTRHEFNKPINLQRYPMQSICSSSGVSRVIQRYGVNPISDWFMNSVFHLTNWLPLLRQKAPGHPCYFNQQLGGERRRIHILSQRYLCESEHNEHDLNSNSTCSPPTPLDNRNIKYVLRDQVLNISQT